MDQQGDYLTTQRALSCDFDSIFRSTSVIQMLINALLVLFKVHLQEKFLLSNCYLSSLARKQM